jgi:N-acyl homoserine lactone hydrolase
VVFDTPMHPDCQHDPAQRIGSRIAGLFSFRYKPGGEISARLKAIDQDPAKIEFIINSLLSG